MSERLDIVLFGATGFTGKHAIPILNRLAQARNRNLKWGVAGRSQVKLREVLLECQKQLDTPIEKILTIEADTLRPDTLNKMARQARIIINCVGPFRFHGEEVVRACIEEGAHYVDITTESQFIAQMAIKYHQDAETKNIYVISGCGFQSIAADLGVVFLQKKFKGTVNWVEAYMKLGGFGYFGGAAVNFGTWESAVHAVANRGEVESLQKQLYSTSLPELTPTLDQKLIPHQIEVLGEWNTQFLMATDRCIIERSQYFFYKKKNQRPVQAMTYLQLSNLITLGIFITLSIIFYLHTLVNLGKTLLLKFPQFYSLWMITKEPPSEARIKNSWFKLTIYGQGWKKTSTNPNEEFGSSMDQELTVSVYGKNPGYGATNICAILAAIKVITETNKIPGKGGALPPGYAFAETSLIDELNENRVSFEVVENKLE